MTNISTPRADKAACEGVYLSTEDYSSTHNKQIVHLDFARTLERELTHTKAQLTIATLALTTISKSTEFVADHGSGECETRDAIIAKKALEKITFNLTQIP